MDRIEMEELLSRSLDGELSESERQTLERALADSESLRALQQDLAALHQLEVDVVPLYPVDPPSALQARVDKRYGAVAGRGRIPGLGGWVLAAAILVLGFTAWWFLQPQPAGETTLDALAEIQREVQNTRARYHEAIQKMEVVAVQRLEQMPANLAITFAEDLQNVNQAIFSAETLVEAYPENHLAYAALSRAYHAKVSLLEKILAV